MSMPPTKRRKLDLSGSFYILVGKQSKSFSVPEAFLTQSSEFSKACVNRNWEKRRSRIVKLAEMNADAFNMYLQWLYTGDVVYRDEDEVIITSNSPVQEQEGSHTERIAVLLQLTVLADTLGDIQFTNVIIDAIIRTCDDTKLVLGSDEVHTIYDRLPVTSHIRAFTVDDYAHNAPLPFLKDEKKSFPADIVFDLMIKLAELQDSGKTEEEPTFKNRCKYHVDNDKVPKCN